MERQKLNSELVKLSRTIVELFKRDSDPNVNSLIDEYRLIERFGCEPIRLKKEYLKSFEQKHQIRLPQIIIDIIAEFGEHPLCHFFLSPRTKYEFLEPTYVIRNNLFVDFISNGVSIHEIEKFKSDYNIYFDPTKDKFTAKKLDAVYQDSKLEYEQNFDLILNTCQEVQILLNTENVGKLVSTNAGDQIISINGSDYIQPYYLVIEDTSEEIINEIHLDHIKKVIERLKNKLEDIVTKTNDYG